ncbi:MAG: hypothetical protein IJ638_02595 [Alphaproteobacteria bacterium]|nr:hypothetical protein [Alphaproteobacteria bacterium]
MELTGVENLKIEKSKMYFLLPYGLGDTMILCGLKPALEEKYSTKIHFLIKDSHKIVMDMFKISDFSIIDISKVDLFLLGDATPTPTKGKIFVAHPEFHKELLYLFNEINTSTDGNKTAFIDWYKKFLGLPQKTKLALPSWYPEPSNGVKKKIKKLGGASKIIVLIPEANSMQINNKTIWKNIIKSNKQFKPVCIVNNKKNRIKGIKNLTLDLYNTVALMMNCHSVYAIRSGLCDLVANDISNMTVLYSNQHFKDVYSLKPVNENIVEWVIEDEKKYDKKIKLKLFGFFTILKIIKVDRSLKFYLFDIIPLLKIQGKDQK